MIKVIKQSGKVRSKLRNSEKKRNPELRKDGFLSIEAARGGRLIVDGVRTQVHFACLRTGLFEEKYLYIEANVANVAEYSTLNQAFGPPFLNSKTRMLVS
jgi:hypothetical protein